MGRIRFGVVLVGALALVLSACGGGSDDSEVLNLDKAKQEILRLSESAFSSQFRVGAVRCPSEVPQKKGLTFFCTVDIENEPLRVNIEQTDDAGNVKILQAQAVLVTQKMEEFVGSYLNKQGKTGSTVDCGDVLVHIETPGRQLKCSITYADGTKGVATLGVKDTTGTTPLISIKPAG